MMILIDSESIEIGVDLVNWIGMGQLIQVLSESLDKKEGREL